MKKTSKLFGIFAVAAMAVIGCAKEIDAPKEEVINEPEEKVVETHTVTISTGAPETKTVINEGVSSASFKWSADDASRFHIWENSVAGTGIALETNDEYATVKLTATFATESAPSYTYTAFLANNVANDSDPQVPAAQTCTGTSYDPDADILVALPATNEGAVLEKIDMRFGRPCVINKMTLKGLTEGETVSSVEIRADKDLVGYYDIAGQSWTGESSKIVLTTSQIVPASGQVVVYFVTMPVSSATLTVTAITDAHIYDKTFTKTINFVMDQVTTFGVSGLTQYAKRDVLTLPLTAVSGNSYSDFSGKSYSGAGRSSAVYAGTIAGSNDAIQINANSGTSYRGIVTTASGGSIKKVRVAWESHTANDRALTVYGKNTAYSTADLNNSFGTEIGSITSGSAVQTTIDSYYEFIMFKAAKAIYLDEIEVFWDNIKSDSGIKWTTDGASGDAVAAATAVMQTGPDDMPSAALYNPNSINPSEISFTSSNTDVATIGEHSGVITLVGEGDTDISAVFLGNASYKPITVKYTLSVTDNRTVPIITLTTTDVELTDLNFNSFTGRSATVDHDVTLVYSKVDLSSIIDEFSTSTGALTLSGNTGTATVTVSFAGDAEYQAAESKSYRIIVASSSGPEDRSAPGNPTITAISPTSFTATWTAPVTGGSEDGYSWKLSESSNPADAAITNGTGNVYTGVLTVTVSSGIALTKDKNYYFHVLTRGDGGTNYNDSDYATSPAKQYKVSTLTFTAGCSGSGTADDGISWTVTSDAEESTYDGTKGVHYGTSKAAVSYLKLSTSGISGTIVGISVNASGASGTTAKLDVKVGESAFGTQQSLTSSAASYSLTGSASGTIEVSITQSSAKKALYCKSVAVTYF